MPNENSNSVLNRYHGELGDMNWGELVSGYARENGGVRGHFRNNPMEPTDE